MSSGFEVETMPLASRIPTMPKAMLPRVRVAWQQGSESKEVRIEKSAIVGSSPSVPIRIDDPLVSRLHAELTVHADGIWVRDLASKNGTFVEGVRVIEGQVPPGGRIRIGATVLKVIETWDAAPAETWPEESLGILVGKSAPMRELFARIVRVASTSMPVLVQGEVGVGKELVARAIHARSAFADGPFVTVDGAALGALDLDIARGGTVFIDEVADLGPTGEAALLRMLDAAKVRFVAATRHDLPKMVGAGALREDLYFRLSVLPIAVPPLRERLEDLPLLVRAFLPAEEHHALTPALISELAARPWRGNVRELRNFVERALTFGTDEALDLLPPSRASEPARSSLPRVSADEPFKVVRDRWVVHLEREYLRAMLARTGGNVSAAAEAAGLDRAYVYRLIRKHGL